MLSMQKRKLNHFSLAQICRSGQCFRMDPIGDGRYRVIAGDQYLEISQKGDECIFFCTQEAFESFWKRYFDLGTDYSAFLARIDPEDMYLREAAAFGSGIRILRQDLWEMTVSFLISQRNHIVRIKRCIQNICEAYGKRQVGVEGAMYYAFPRPEDLAGLEEDGLLGCNLGYRSKYVVRAARDVVSGKVDFDKIGRMPYEEARGKLMELYGAGRKVADCICLFALHQLESFPVDTHISQALGRYYPAGFPQNRYKGMQGVLQQYIFYYELEKPCR